MQINRRCVMTRDVLFAGSGVQRGRGSQGRQLRPVLRREEGQREFPSPSQTHAGRTHTHTTAQQVCPHHTHTHTHKHITVGTCAPHTHTHTHTHIDSPYLHLPSVDMPLQREARDAYTHTNSHDTTCNGLLLCCRMCVAGCVCTCTGMLCARKYRVKRMEFLQASDHCKFIAASQMDL